MHYVLALYVLILDAIKKLEMYRHIYLHCTSLSNFTSLLGVLRHILTDFDGKFTRLFLKRGRRTAGKFSQQLKMSVRQSTQSRDSPKPTEIKHIVGIVALLYQVLSVPSNSTRTGHTIVLINLSP